MKVACTVRSGPALMLMHAVQSLDSNWENEHHRGIIIAPANADLALWRGAQVIHVAPIGPERTKDAKEAD